MSYKSLFSIEVDEGGLKVIPSEELKSMSVPKQMATIESNLKMYEAKLQEITDNPESSEKTESDKCEVELVILVLKNFLKQFREANWEIA
ncbi:hypothetical protein SAMN04489760_1017 [Syntrophus gentianae]|uniref:Uncharacterized protein n=1 Tax=Syntrophus gentianae TaxID=43775 RepID=A0A1H7U7T1_9BACT|nr:hypothetical protein [Syntrophus gentianae]SEL92688.1 hypothetical protein SAMN04489760_1017 [Syntrophus gentianae]